MAKIRCPLCGEPHDIGRSEKGKEYFYCREARSTVWLTNPTVRRNIIGGERPRSVDAEVEYE